MQSLDTLTAFQLDTAASDLRNAGLVIKHAGHFRGSIMDPRTGAMCAAGAIDVSTFRTVRYLEHIRRYAIGDDHSDNYRAENAYIAFANFIPTGLCHKCDYDEECAYCREAGTQCSTGEATAWERVVHYNDFHCVGGDLAINMLNLAADYAAQAAQSRRAMLAERLAEDRTVPMELAR